MIAKCKVGAGYRQVCSGALRYVVRRKVVRKKRAGKSGQKTADRLLAMLAADFKY